jgi:two-component system, cell cycle sensor histidine kinase and response regulator CckA
MILVVDDSEALIYCARFALESDGFEVCTATNGPAALDVLEAEGDRVSVVVLDLSMPKMNGLVVFDAMQDMRPGIPVILSSGWNEKEVQEQLEGRLVASFIGKPYKLESLVELVHRVLDSCKVD